jgi:succinyl-diaminopimelate desuccinylase
MAGTLSDEAVTNRVTELTRELVRIRSQGGIDPVDRVVALVADRLSKFGLWPERLQDAQGRVVGIYARVPPLPIPALKSIGLAPEQPAGRRLCLNACIDTAPTGSEEVWSRPPFSGDVEDGRLYGRGSADSKVGCALFLTLAAELFADKLPERGSLDLLFDADEHTGRFGGVKAYVERFGKPDAVAIGYPGNEKIIVGARGFLRADVTTFGRTEHSGRRQGDAPNAVLKMARLVTALSEWVPPLESDPHFSFGPKLSVTAIAGGEGFSQIPDRCTCKVDVRLTPHFDAIAGREAVETVVRAVDEQFPDPSPSEVAWRESWPAYRLDDNEPLVVALRDAANGSFGRDIPTAVSGASNIGNYLRTLEVPAVCGFGVSYQNLHATDEFIELATIAPTYRAYREAVVNYLHGSLGRSLQRHS